MAIWKGKHNFNEEHGEIFKDKSIDFEMHITVDDGSFSGTFIDPEFAELNETEIKVSGFFEDNFVSFVITYPFRKIYNGDGTPVLLMDKLNHEVNYYGEFQENSKIISGDWEIIEVMALDLLGNQIIFSTGTFEMEEKV